MKENLNTKSIIFLLILPICVIIGFVLDFAFGNLKNLSEGNNFQKIEQLVSTSTPFYESLKKSGVGIRYSFGETLQDDILISASGLMHNMQDSDQSIRQQNNDAVKRFNQFVKDLNQTFNEDDISVFLMISPSASGVMKDALPPFSNTINQTNLIENSYNQVSSEVNTISVHNRLFENKEKYIYFRTQNSMTPMGGYYVYDELISRMLVSGDVIPLTDMGVSYSDDEFYGDLYAEKPFKKVRPDLLTYYDYPNRSPYSISYFTGALEKKYDSFYDKSLHGMDTYRYNEPGVLRVTTENDTDIKLLIIGDSSPSLWLPFISNHYDHTTYINIQSFSQTLINLNQFDQILIAVDVDTYMHSDNLSIVLNDFIK